MESNSDILHERGNTADYPLILAALLTDIGFLTEESPPETPQKKITPARDFVINVLSKKPCVVPLKEDILNYMGDEAGILGTILKDAYSLTIKSEKAENTPIKEGLLSSLTSRISLGRNKSLQISGYLPRILTTSDVFPSESGSYSSDKVIGLRKSLYKSFLAEFELLPGNDLIVFTDSLITLLEKYLTFVPVAGEITLFDHLKSAAALAICMKRSDESNNKFLIVAADVSGIQNFIYSEYSPIENLKKGLSKRLRGKSFYLAMLTDSFIEMLLREFNLPRTNLLLNGGGSFLLLLPNSSQNRKLLESINVKMQNWFLKNFRNEINIVIASVQADDSLYSSFPSWYNIISSELQAAKKQKNIKILNTLFETDIDSPNFEIPPLPAWFEKKGIYENLNKTELAFQNLSDLFELLGMSIPKAKYLLSMPFISQAESKTDFRDIFHFPLPAFNTAWYFLKSDQELNRFFGHLKEETSCMRLHVINDTSLFESLPLVKLLSDAANRGLKVAPVFKFIGNTAPLDKDESIMEFEKIAALNTRMEENKKISETLDYPLLGVLRMDVDNLGAIFSFGLESNSNPGNIRTLTRVVQLSRLMNHFFTGYINEIADRHDMYITYSGGDDLFAVGSWINCIEFASDVREKFSLFSSGNPDLTLSAGLHLCKPGFPIGKSAAQSGAAEEKAKEKPGKDSISVFGRVFGWSDFTELYKYGKELDALVKNPDNKQNVKSSYIHFLLTKAESLLTENENEIDVNKYFGAIAKIKYSLARSPREINNNEIQSGGKEKVKLLAKLITGPFNNMYLRGFILPASYVILLNRKSKN